MIPSLTIHPAILPAPEILNTSLISAWPRYFSVLIGLNSPDNKALISSTRS